MNKNKNILICPLEWGLGHATRMIPLVRKLMERNNNIFIGSGEAHLALFRSELPGLTYINFSGFSPGYSRYFPQYFVLLLKTPFLLYHIILEHIRLKRIIREYSIDIVISDNRFGLWNKNVTTVFVTHMPRIPFPEAFRSFEIIGVRLMRSVIKRFSFCFIPDLPGELNISGRLSHGIKLPGNVRFIGILSRFTDIEQSVRQNQIKFEHNTAILTGPEPQRGMLKQDLVRLLIDQEPSTVMLEGRPDKQKEIIRTGNILFYNHLDTPDMKEMIAGSKSIISRSGYTTIMDLISLNRTALLIPTPGQTEQEYLAGYLAGRGWFYTIPQGEIKSGISPPSNEASWPGEIIEQSRFLLEKAIKELLKKSHKNS